MTYKTSTSFQIPAPYYNSLFEALAGNNVLLQADAPTFTILASSPSYLQQTGYTKEAIVGRGMFEAFPGNANPNDTGEKDLRASLQHVLLHKEQHQLPVQRYDLVGEDGRFVERYWRAVNKPVFSPDGKVVYIMHTAEDITQEVKANQLADKIKGMEQAYNLFMQTPIPIFILKGPELVVELANRPTLQLWGRTEEVIGLPLEEAIPEVKGQGYAELMNRVRETGIPSQVYENPVTLVRNGKEEVVYINYVYEPYYEEVQKEAVGVLAIGSDVTDKVLAKKVVIESEARFRNMIEQAPVGIALTLGIDMVFDNINPPCCRSSTATAKQMLLAKKLVRCCLN